MSSNIRSKSIEGHVTDSAGNVLRNSNIVIKQVTPSGNISVDTIVSDDGGYFISKPIPNGIYDIYESGIRIGRTIHSPDESSIQCYKASRENYNFSTFKNFSYLLTGANNLNSFKAFIQIESSEVDVSQYGNSFPIYNFQFDSSDDPGLSGYTNELWNISKFMEFNNDSRLTATRFDVEYYLPLTATSNSYKRIRWSGVPGIRYFKDSKLVLPLDYFSLVLNNPKRIEPESANYNADLVTIKYEGSEYIISGDSENMGIANSLSIGDVVEVSYSGGIFYGILKSISYNGGTSLSLQELKSSRYLSTAGLSSSPISVTRLMSYDGMFGSIMDINDDVNERFSVVENTYAQNLRGELYSYVNQI